MQKKKKKGRGRGRGRNLTAPTCPLPELAIRRGGGGKRRRKIIVGGKEGERWRDPDGDYCPRF